MEIEGKSGIILAGIDEVEYIILMLNEAFNEEGGGEERVGVEVASVHVVWGRFGYKKASWLDCEFRQLSEVLYRKFFLLLYS